jgi:hypothetical protein
MTTEKLEVEEHPFTVRVSEYIPLAITPELEISGSSTVEVNPLGPFQE